MQKKLIALAIAGFATAPAYAQWTMMNVQSPTPGLTMFGIIDQALESGSYGDGSVLRLTGSGYTTQRFGVRGNEDLGGGMRANFWLEASLGPDVGTGGAGTTSPSVAGAAAGVAQNKTTGVTSQQWDRAATVGLSSPSWGALNLGRQYTPWFSAWARSDVFRVAGVGSSYALQFQNTRMNNSIRYDSPGFSGFQVILGYALSDQGSAYGFTESVGGAAATSAATGLAVNQKASGRQSSAALVYDNGPWQGGLGYAKVNGVTAVGAATPIIQTTQWSANGSYNFNIVKLIVGYSSWHNDAQPRSVDRTTWNIHLAFPVTATSTVYIGTQSMKDKILSSNNARQIGLQYAYNMSKRTTLYATYGRISNDNTGAAALLSGSAATNNAQAGFDPSAIQLGVNHVF